jgi:hypothetical protein
MNRISSTAVAAALAATLLVAAAPAAQARNLAKPRPAAAVATGGWVDAALNWLGGFYPIPFPPYKPMTGACIDPNGCVFGSGN